MRQYVLHAYAFGLQTAKNLTNDIPDEKFCEQPGGVLNHPAFVLSHLACTSDFICSMLGAPSAPRPWQKDFNSNAKPHGDRSKYPSKAELLATLEDGHVRVARAFEAVDEAVLAKESEFAKWGFPKVGDMVLHLLVAHEATHLGQLSMWRRAQGMPPLF
jgi:hypothetical protein